MAVSTRCLSDHHGPLIAPATDDPIQTLLDLQQDNWISVVTDGELKRAFNADPVAEAKNLASKTDLLIKIRLPGRSGGAIADTATLKALLDLGVGYIQLDGTAYAPLMHKAARAADADAELDKML